MFSLNIPVLLGTERVGRESEHVAAYVLKQAEQYGFQTQLIDVAQCKQMLTTPLRLQSNDEKTKWWGEVMAKADGLIVVSPEYNHGYPGELKMILDHLFDEYNHKPIAICGVSNGGLGGARMVEQLRLVAITLKMVPTSGAVYFSNVKSLFDEKGNVTDATYDGRMTKLFDELKWYGEALKLAREQTLKT